MTMTDRVQCSLPLKQSLGLIERTEINFKSLLWGAGGRLGKHTKIVRSKGVS